MRDFFDGSGALGCLAALIGVLFVLFVGYGLVSCGVGTYRQGEITFTVNEKIQKSSGDDDQKYLIFTDHGVYQNTDNILRGKTHSSDLEAQLKVGHKYRCTWIGYRWGLDSEYRNLLKCAEVGR